MARIYRLMGTIAVHGAELDRHPFSATRRRWMAESYRPDNVPIPCHSTGGSDDKGTSGRNSLAMNCQ
jgi:hypothetical protein